MNKKLSSLIGALAGLALAPAAQAQSLRPNILILFDTSGSMLLSQASDGSPLCGGAGTTSRVYSLKNALRQALAQVGTDEANFGLMRFPQIEDPALSFTCPRGHQSLAGTSVGALNGCRLTTQSSTTPETTYGPWYDNGISQAVLIPVTKPTSGLKPTLGTAYDPSDANISEVYRWIDLTDSGATGANNPDPELRIPANTSTPLGRSIFYSRLYFENYVYPNDPKKSCRTNLVIIATDGADTCDATKAGGATLNTATCVQTPAASYTTFHPEVQACLLNHSAVIPQGVKTYILTDNGLTAGEKTTANLIASAGGTTQAIFVTLTDTNSVKQALVDIIAKTVPPTEVCNGVDDNCNGLIDEGVSNLCPFDPSPAHKHCAVEICNCVDDDCDGQVDEGFAPNACGGPGCCAVPVETCNGLDDNCDGQIDEGFGVGTPCTNNGVGACRRGGRLACKADGTGVFCDAPVVAPQPETCNKIDDDCNGLVDDGPLPGVGEKCGNGLGTCSAGTFVCNANGKLVCNSTSMPMAETCNGKDDDCDGVIDNGNFPTVGQSCVCAGLDPAKVGIGVCKGGHIICKGTLGLVCDGCIGPSAEICDGKDNDCDGVIDTTAMCPSGFGCREGQCTLACQSGEFPCPSGYKCVADFCVPQRCAAVTCAAGKRCDENTGQCVDLCSGVVCPAPKVCMQGRCLDCNTLGCDPDQLCVAGICQADKCKGVSCPNGRYCADGKCVDLCLPDKCSGSSRCVAGQCLTDKCASVACGAGQFCDPTTGSCKTDSCESTQCNAGERCVSSTGQCAPDPCRLIQCPTDCWTCGTTAEGTGSCILRPECRQTITQVGQRGGGSAGCSCAVGEGGGGGRGAAGLALLLGATMVVARRRRRRR